MAWSNTTESSRSETSSSGSATEQPANVGRGLTIRGMLTGSDSMTVEGRVEGEIRLPGQRVTVTQSGKVFASIEAREIIVFGEVRGNCVASERVDIRTSGSLTGDVIAARISIEDGAHFKGGIEIRQPGLANRMVAEAGSALAEEYDARAEESISEGRYVTIHDDAEIDQVLSGGRSSRTAQAAIERKVEMR